MKNLFAVLAILIACASPTVAQAPAEASGAAPLDAARVEAWADTYFGDALEHHRFSGATAVLVQNGEIVFSHGYGHDDVATDMPLDVDSTGFHLGSIGKVFTGTAIGQLLETGAIASIDDPANRYLTRFQLPDAPNRPITIRDLLTHQAGFEDWFYGIINETPVETPQSGDFIEHFMPDVVTDAGDGIVYSSFGIAMLGAIVEDVSGQSYRDYVAQNIFAPLGMANSEIPYDPVAPDSMGHAYAFYPSGEAALKPRVIAYPFFAPAGVAIATPNDFARFMMAQLGELDGQDVLGDRLRTRLHTELARNHPAMTGIAMVFGRLDYNGQQVIYHAGNGPGFDSFMALFPDQNAGIFVATMGGPPAPGLVESLMGSARMSPADDVTVDAWMGAQEAIVAMLVDSFGPVPLDVQPAGDLSRYAGTYWGERRSHSTWEAVLGLAMNFPDTVTVVENGLMISGRGPYLPIGNDTFQREDDTGGVRRVAFTFEGQPVAQLMHPFPGLDVSHRTNGPHPGQTIMPLLVGLPLLLSGLLCAFYPYGPAGPTGRPARTAMSRMKWLPPVMFLVLVGGLLAVIAGHPPEEDFFFGIGRSFNQPWRFVSLIIAVNATAIGSLALVWITFCAWPGRYWARGWLGWLVRGHFTLVTLGWLAVMPFFAIINLLGWHWP